MLDESVLRQMKSRGRVIEQAYTGDDELGPLQLLPGTWKNVHDNVPVLPGRGWNMIALPFATEPPAAPNPINYRLLLNQYNEELTFSLVDKAVPNRGIERGGARVMPSDQFLAALDYEQTIVQIDAEDRPDSGLAGGPKLPIHHEPGLWLHMGNEFTDGLNLGRLATIPHGNSVLALGKSRPISGAPEIPTVSGLPIGVDQDLMNPDNKYLAPYKHYHEKPFNGLFDPVSPNDLLAAANQGVDIVETTELHVDTTLLTGGIVNIPFIERQADATEMQSTFWIQKLRETDAHGDPKLRLQYSQTVMLDFFPRRDGVEGLIKWPHVSINTMEKVVSP